MNIPMSGPDLSEAEFEAVHQVLASRSLSIGPQIQAFERAVASWVGRDSAVGVSSGTSALHLAVLAAGIQDNDWVITTPFSFVASANVLLYERAVPIFVDVDARTGNLDPEQVRAAVQALSQGGRAADKWLPRSRRQLGVTRETRLRALLPVHVFGQPADMEPLLDTAREYNLQVIEDACEALGSAYRGLPAGAWGDLAVFAFYPNKQLTTGEGGMVVTSRLDWDALLRSLRNQGRDTHSAWLRHDRLGYNYRLDEMSAALGVTQMRRLELLLHKREQVAQWYGERLAEIEWIETPVLVPTTTRMSWFVYVVRVRAPLRRDEVMRLLAQVGIPTRPYFNPIHLQPFYVERFGYRAGDFPQAEALGASCMALPFSGVMTEEQVEYVCRNLCAVTAELAAPKSMLT